MFDKLELLCVTSSDLLLTDVTDLSLLPEPLGIWVDAIFFTTTDLNATKTEAKQLDNVIITVCCNFNKLNNVTSKQISDMVKMAKILFR